MKSRSLDMPDTDAPEFIQFLVRPRNGAGSTFVNIGLRKPIKLYDDAPFSPYRVARAKAWKLARVALELSPSMPMLAEPHDWSDGVDALNRKHAEQSA
jgi:hypothetical protein